MRFTTQLKVLFHHCDPAGIVFYPRYLEMANTVVETWFAEHLGVPFEELHGPMNAGVPTARLAIEFHAPSRHGDMLEFSLDTQRIGASSADIKIAAKCGEENRFTMTSTLVYVDKRTVKPQPWPESLLERLSK